MVLTLWLLAAHSYGSGDTHDRRGVPFASGATNVANKPAPNRVAKAKRFMSLVSWAWICRRRRWRTVRLTA